MFQLEKGSKKYVCPGCSQKKFVRYRNDSGDYLPESVGRCDRESKCGYHFTPKMFFEANPELAGQIIKPGASRPGSIIKPRSETIYQEKFSPKPPGFIDFELFKRTLAKPAINCLVKFLLNAFPEDAECVFETVKKYFIGSTREGKTIFWQIDDRGKIRTGKIIAYDPEKGKRRKDISPGWVHAETMKRQGKEPGDYNLKQCFFGEHLLSKYPGSPVAIVEAEKTALIASMCFPQFVWLAVGGKQNLKAEKLEIFKDRNIFLYPDADGFDKWREIAAEACEKGLWVNLSNWIERRATDDEKRGGSDLADYLIGEQRQINEFNARADFYNSKLEKVLEDERLFEKFNFEFDARNLNPDDLDQIREIVLQIA